MHLFYPGNPVIFPKVLKISLSTTVLKNNYCEESLDIKEFFCKFPNRWKTNNVSNSVIFAMDTTLVRAGVLTCQNDFFFVNSLD
jgi:hypothetical protein